MIIRCSTCGLVRDGAERALLIILCQVCRVLRYTRACHTDVCAGGGGYVGVPHTVLRAEWEEANRIREGRFVFGGPMWGFVSVLVEEKPEVMRLEFIESDGRRRHRAVIKRCRKGWER